MRKVGILWEGQGTITIEYDNNAITVGRGEFKKALEALWNGQFKT